MHFLSAETAGTIKENKILSISAFAVVIAFVALSCTASLVALASSQSTQQSQQGSIITSIRSFQENFLNTIFKRSKLSAVAPIDQAETSTHSASTNTAETMSAASSGWFKSRNTVPATPSTPTTKPTSQPVTPSVPTQTQVTQPVNSFVGQSQAPVPATPLPVVPSTPVSPIKPVAPTSALPTAPKPAQSPVAPTMPKPTAPKPLPVVPAKPVVPTPSAPVMPTAPKPTLPPVAPTMPNSVVPVTPNNTTPAVPIQPAVPGPTVVRTTPIAAMTSDSYPNPFETYPPILTAGSNIVKNLSAQPLGLGCELMKTSVPTNKKKIVVSWKAYNATSATVNGKNALSNKAVITSGNIYSNEIAFNAKTATSFELVVKNGTDSKTCRLMIPVIKTCSLELMQNEYVDQRTVDYKLTLPAIPGASYVAAFTNFQKKFIGSVYSSQVLASGSSVVMTGELSKTYFPDNYKFQVTASIALADVWSDNKVYTSSCTGMYTATPTPTPKTPTLPTPKPGNNQGNNEGGGDRDRTPSGTGGGSPTGSGGGTPSGTGGGGKLNKDNVNNNNFGNVGQ